MLQLTQQQAIRKSGDLRSDSITALTFQLEREFLRLRQSMELASRSKPPLALDELRLRSDIFASRFQLMHDTPSTTALQEREEYTKVMPRLEALVTQVDRLLQNGHSPQPHELRPLLAELNELGPDVQELTMAATSHIAGLLEEQESTMLTQGQQIMALIFAQLVLLLLAAGALAWRQTRQEQERIALQTLTDNLRAANNAAEEANRGKSQFLANMSHELRTPFNGVLGMLTLLERTRLDGSQREYVYTARNSADHLLSLLNDILDVSAMESGKMGIHPIAIPLQPLVDSIDQLMRPLASQKGLGFAIHTAADLPAWVEADGTRLKQIVLNLVTNAIKFSDSGAVTVKIGRAPQATTGNEGIYLLQLEVADQGIGMDAATLSRLFERFTQGDASTSRRFGGTGLGLEISRNLARRMGGDITVQSAEGHGSTFTVTLPLLEAAPPNAATQPSEMPAPFQPELTGLDVLVADDQMVNRKYMGALLISMGHHPRFAENGEQACLEIQKKPPDLVLMDLHMPIMDGFQATQQIRQWPQFTKVPIVALTADVFAETRQRANDVGMNAFISKPVSVDTIQSLLADMFSANEKSAPATSSVADLQEAPCAPTASAEPEAPKPAAQRAPRRRFRSGDVTAHINMPMVGEVCIGVNVQGYRSLLQGYFSDESGSLDALLQALQEGKPESLRAAAHGFKGASANLGFQKLADLAFELEKHEENGRSLREAHTQLLAAWEMTHALCLRMGLTDVENVLDRHRNPSAVTEITSAPAPAPAPA
ncbi:ATP-binding protein [Acidovorax sp. 62]|uniref:ATP-binding protein n=1 Tax=Acidovorax sp. 62 TaxID=2035203 RepID=UPI0013042E46|nr:ATP-binding protein [Acidovorax sp. 62]